MTPPSPGPPGEDMVDVAHTADSGDVAVTDAEGDGARFEFTNVEFVD